MNRMTLLGVRHFEGTTKDGKPYSFDSVAFLGNDQSDSVRGSWPMICNPTKDVDVDELVPGREYEVYGIFSNNKYYVNFVKEI